MSWRMGSQTAPVKTFISLMHTYLYDEGAEGQLDPDTYIRKLKKLTKTQFEELATDVYDELDRRLYKKNDFPFLPVNENLHPKRNQARQKLATLTKEKLNELVIDTYMEISFRYPKIVADIINSKPPPKKKSIISGFSGFGDTSIRPLEPNSAQNGQQYELSNTSWEPDNARNKNLPKINNGEGRERINEAPDSRSSPQSMNATSTANSQHISSGSPGEVNGLRRQVEKLSDDLKAMSVKNAAFESKKTYYMMLEESNKKQSLENTRLHSENKQLLSDFLALKKQEKTLREQLDRMVAENNLLKLKIDNMKSGLDDDNKSNTGSYGSESPKFGDDSDRTPDLADVDQSFPEINSGVIKMYQASVDELTMTIINLKISPKNISKSTESQIMLHLENVINSIEPVRTEVLEHRKFHMRQLTTMKKMSANQRAEIKSIFSSRISADTYMELITENIAQIPSLINHLNTCIHNLEIAAKQYVTNLGSATTSEVERAINGLQRVVNDLYNKIDIQALLNGKHDLQSENESQPKQHESGGQTSTYNQGSDALPIEIEALQNRIMVDSNQVVDQIQSVLQLLRLTPGGNEFFEENGMTKNDYGSISIVLNDNLRTISLLLKGMVENCKPQFEKQLHNYSGRDSVTITSGYNQQSVHIDYRSGLEAINGLDHGMLQICDYCDDITDVADMIESPDMSFRDYVYSNFDKKLKNYDFRNSENIMFCVKLFDPLVIDLIHDPTFKQNIVSTVFGIAKNTKILVTLFN